MNGQLKILKEGTTKISCFVDGKSATYRVRILKTGGKYDISLFDGGSVLYYAENILRDILARMFKIN